MDTLQTTNGTAVGAKPIAEKQKRKRVMPSLPTANAGSLTKHERSMQLDTTPVAWESLPLYALFTLASDGTGSLYFKAAKSKYVDLNSGKSDWASSGRCYRVIL